MGAAHRATAVGDARPDDRREPPRRRRQRSPASKSRCAEPDGYTLMLGSSAPLAIGPALYPNQATIRAPPLCRSHWFPSTPYIMVGAMNAPFKTVPELLAYAKANPGRLNIRGAQRRAAAHVGRNVPDADRRRYLIVPYRGASTLITDMIAGRIHGGFETTSVMFAPFARGQDPRPRRGARRASAAASRSADHDRERRSTGVIGSSWIGVVAPSGTPKAIVARLRVEIIAACAFARSPR